MKRNADFWHWYPSSYPTDKGIRFSFATMNFALRFMRKFKTMPFEISIQYNYKDYIVVSQGRSYYSIKMLNQNEPTKEQYTWLKRCDPDKKEKPMTFEEFKRGYKIYVGPKPKESKYEPVWYIESLDYSKGHGYQGSAGNEATAISSLRKTFDSLRNRGEQ